MGAHLTAEEQAGRDELAIQLLAEAPSGLTEYELGRRLLVRLDLKRGIAGSNGLGQSSLRRLEAAGRARCEREPWNCTSGFRRVWYPTEERS